MTSFKDAVKNALNIKRASRGLGKVNSQSHDTGTVKSQVVVNKPAKKSAGRGR
jgi:hypothetical protein